MRFTVILFVVIFLNACHSSKTESERILNTVSKNDVALQTPQPGEWLTEHKEKGQTFKQYVKAKPIRSSDRQNKIYLQPIGTFNASQELLMTKTAEYLHLFYGIETIVSTPISDSIIPSTARRIGIEENEQLWASYIIDSILVHQIPKDAITVMAFSNLDLYPEPSWNYVFGLATLRKRVGVTSLHRLCNAIDISDELKLNRLIKVSSHEIGHMFTMHHCVHAVCAMNGTNGLHELDKVPNKLCSECLAKVVWNMNFQPKSRFEALITFFKKNHLVDDAKLAEMDLESLN